MALSKNYTTIVIPSILGVASVYTVWGIWGILLGWGQGIYGFSYTYMVGDHAILPLFNAIAFVLLWKKPKRISWKTTLVSLAVIPAAVGILMAFFEPDTSSLRENGSLNSSEVSGVLQWLHLFFIFGEACLVVFMTAVYPFLRRTWKPVLPITVLYALIEVFLSLLFVLDSNIVAFPLWIEALTTSLVAGAWIAFVAKNLYNRLRKGGGLLLIRAVLEIRLVAKSHVNIFKPGPFFCGDFLFKNQAKFCDPVSYTHLTLPTTPYV